MNTFPSYDSKLISHTFKSVRTQPWFLFGVFAFLIAIHFLLFLTGATVLTLADPVVSLIINVMVELLIFIFLVSGFLMASTGENPTLFKSWKLFRKHIGPLTVFALITLTFKFMGYLWFSKSVLGGLIVATTWLVFTFLVIPVILNEKRNVFEALDRNFLLIRHVWREVLVATGFIISLQILTLFILLGMFSVSSELLLLTLVMVLTFTTYIFWAAFTVAVYVDAVIRYEHTIHSMSENRAV